MARRKFHVSMYDSINVTPLIDTLFFLLIIFMITAPLLEYSVDVTPPKMNAAKIQADENSVSVNIKADGTIIYDQGAVTVEGLQGIFHRIRTDKGESAQIFIRGDERVDYGRVMEVMRLAKNAGFKKVQLLMQEEPKQ